MPRPSGSAGQCSWKGTDHGNEQTVTEELAFKTAEMDAALNDAGFLLAYSDPKRRGTSGIGRGISAGKTTLFPLLNANLEYYLASKAFSLKISPSDAQENKVYSFS